MSFLLAPNEFIYDHLSPAALDQAGEIFKKMPEKYKDVFGTALSSTTPPAYCEIAVKVLHVLAETEPTCAEALMFLAEQAFPDASRAVN